MIPLYFSVVTTVIESYRVLVRQ